MRKLEGLYPEKVFYFFEELCRIPHGSGNTEKISEWCVNFAKSRNLQVIKDRFNNVAIFKKAYPTYEDCPPIILQGHLDMVCQKTRFSDTDLQTDPLEIFADGDFIGAKDTTLGADDGIGVAIILAILDSDDIPHPPIEALFTADEETGMSGALNFDTTVLKGKTLINLDSEVLDTVTVSCAGGEDVTVTVPFKRTKTNGDKITIALSGLKGGHSGIEIDKNRINASVLLSQILKYVNETDKFQLVSFFGGDKTNAIAVSAYAEIIPQKSETLEKLTKYTEKLKLQVEESEPNFNCTVTSQKNTAVYVADKIISENTVSFLSSFCQGVISLSEDIKGLVESSQNLGIVSTSSEQFSFTFSLRSGKYRELLKLEDSLKKSCAVLPSANISLCGAYPPWEYRRNSEIREKWCKIYKEELGFLPKVEAVHAGLECGIFASSINNLDCISVGPNITDIHTVNERLQISTVQKLWKILLQTLKTR